MFFADLVDSCVLSGKKLESSTQFDNFQLMCEQCNLGVA